MRDLGRQEASAGALGVVVTVPVPTGQKRLDSLAETWDFLNASLNVAKKEFPKTMRVTDLSLLLHVWRESVV